MRAWAWAVGALASTAVVLLAPAAGQAGGAPVIAWSPTTSPGTYDYGTLDASTGQTASTAFTLTNSDGVATAALKVTLAGSAAFTVTADGCSATSLGPKKTCVVTVEYAPTTNGTSDTATLTASSKKPTVTATVTLIGASSTPTGNADATATLGAGVTLPVLNGVQVTLGDFDAILTDSGGNTTTLALAPIAAGSSTYGAAFNFLLPGTYSVSLAAPTGMSFSTSPSIPVVIGVLSGQTTEVDFTITAASAP